ncbi:OB-fold domain-containing protein [Sphingobium sp. JS3065]|jgi:uncharacterized OB-fold protein|uniref:Zn-ribbon domain-containing OB-fold protein n=1 Tax=Sphingobium sp. JS3065 TaxID=2970925 RepID=UPI002263B87F|nr:OB-fold domain-containing protein [Sphingobium sp. JS3065]UZW57390.1 OB-fold domain-containing protein [Sphingobium sp. JS3065]
MTDRHPSDGPEIAFQKHLAAGRFMLQRGVRTGTWVYYPRAVAPITGEDLEWAEPSGLGTVYSTTAIRKRPPEPSLNIALIDLDEGPRMMSRVEGIDAQEVKIGMRVKARIVAGEGEDAPHLVVFGPVESGQ